MPNWTSNILTIEGAHDVLVALQSKLGQPRPALHTTDDCEEFVSEWQSCGWCEPRQDSLFWNIISPEEDAYPTYISDPGPHGWYEWNRRNWGTKWDVKPSVFLDRDLLTYEFDTAWSPPEQAIFRLSEQNPDLYIQLQWRDEENDGAVWEFKNGELTVKSAWTVGERKDTGPEEPTATTAITVDNVLELSIFGTREEAAAWFRQNTALIEDHMLEHGWLALDALLQEYGVARKETA